MFFPGIRGDNCLLDSQVGKLMDTIKRMTSIDHKIEAKLTPRQLEIFTLYGEGRSPGQIGESLFISKKTVWTHRGEIIRVLGFEGAYEFLFNAIKWVNFNNNK